MEYLALDLVNTFYFVPRYPEGTPGYTRADYTIDRMRLNRDFLSAARQEAYTSYRARLREYVALKNMPSSAHLAAAISRCGHPTVWAEMKAQAHLIADLVPLFGAAPEAHTW
jgi:hypothetical protein